ncbi:unnamed protein product [Alternaria alternata]
MVTAPYADPMESPPPRSAAVNESDMELRANNRDLDEMRATEPEFSLPPVDGGMAAWLFLFSAFVLEILVWGKSFRLCSNASLSLSVYSKNTTPRTHHSPAPGTYLLSGLAQWA